MTVHLELADRIELLELPGRYGDLIDDRDWDGLARIFVDDATFTFPGHVLDGLDEIRAFMDTGRHPRTHMMTNVYIDEEPTGVIVRFRSVAMRRDGRIASGRYRDVVVRTDVGWRVQERVFIPTPYEDPSESG